MRFQKVAPEDHPVSREGRGQAESRAPGRPRAIDQQECGGTQGGGRSAVVGEQRLALRGHGITF